MGGMQVLLGAVHAAALPTLHAYFGYTIAVASIVVGVRARSAFHAMGCENRSLGAITAARQCHDGISNGALASRGAELLLGLIAFHACINVTFWGYSERIATSSGLSEAEKSPVPFRLAIWVEFPHRYWAHWWPIDSATCRCCCWQRWPPLMW